MRFSDSLEETRLSLLWRIYIFPKEVNIGKWKIITEHAFRACEIVRIK